MLLRSFSTVLEQIRQLVRQKPSHRPIAIDTLRSIYASDPGIWLSTTVCSENQNMVKNDNGREWKMIGRNGAVVSER
jgi:hypothetical protein